MLACYVFTSVTMDGGKEGHRCVWNVWLFSAWTKPSVCLPLPLLQTNKLDWWPDTPEVTPTKWPSQTEMQQSQQRKTWRVRPILQFSPSAFWHKIVGCSTHRSHQANSEFSTIFEQVWSLSLQTPHLHLSLWPFACSSFWDIYIFSFRADTGLILGLFTQIQTFAAGRFF